jgi:hypothetical protein
VRVELVELLRTYPESVDAGSADALGRNSCRQTASTSKSRTCPTCRDAASFMFQSRAIFVAYSWLNIG